LVLQRQLESAGLDLAAELDRFGRGHRVAQRAGDRELDAAEVDQRGVDLESVGDLADAVVEDGVAADPEHAVLLSVPAQGKADDLADDRVAQRWAVAARGRGDLDRRPPRRLQHRRCPGGEPAGVAAEPLRSRHGGHHRPSRGQQRPAGVVEVVIVVIVGEQHGVERAEVGGGDRRPGQLARARSPAEVVFAAGRVEGRIGQQPPAADLDQDGRTADVGDADSLHVRAHYRVIEAGAR
jgi:hypothetical protein